MAFETGFLYAFIYLATALVAVLVGKWTGAGAVLGYLAAGAAIGPWGLGLIGGAEGEDVTHTLTLYSQFLPLSKLLFTYLFYAEWL